MEALQAEAAKVTPLGRTKLRLEHVLLACGWEQQVSLQAHPWDTKLHEGPCPSSKRC